MYSAQINNSQAFAQELSEIKAPIAIAARLGGSTVDFAITGLRDEASIYEISAPQQAQAVEVLFDIIRLVSEKAIEIGQAVLPVTFGVAGSATISEPNKYLGEQALPQAVGLHSLPNYSFRNSTLAEATEHVRQDSLINFYSAMSKALNGLPANLKYIDEAHVSEPIIAAKDSATLTVDCTVRNDTVSIAASCIEGLATGDNSLGLVCGSGFNLGYCENYKDGQFAKEINYEAGHKSISSRFLSPLDIYIADATKRTPEKVFAGGNKGIEDKGIRMQLQLLRQVLADPEETNHRFVEYSVLPHLNRFLDKPLTLATIQHSPLIRVDSLASNKDIVEEARVADPLARALCLSQAQRLGNYLAETFRAEFASSLSSKFAITGSHFLDILSLPGAEDLFSKELAKVRGRMDNQIQLVKFDKDRLDGMIDLVEAQSRALAS